MIIKSGQIILRILIPHTDPGACFVCNTCPSDTDSDSDSCEGYECSGRPTGEGSAACVETTAYTLLALMEAEETDSTVCLAQWLVRIRSGNGGFYSSQVYIYVYSWPVTILCLLSLSYGVT